jgi:hypothetical protein
LIFRETCGNENDDLDVPGARVLGTLLLVALFCTLPLVAAPNVNDWRGVVFGIVVLFGDICNGDFFGVFFGDVFIGDPNDHSCCGADVGISLAGVRTGLSLGGIFFIPASFCLLTCPTPGLRLARVAIGGKGIPVSLQLY